VKNNYSSGRNDDRLQNPNGKNEPQAFGDGEGEEKLADVLACHQYSAVGNMNLNNMLIENIRSHDYFKGLADLKTFEQTVDQIYYDVTYVTPWKPGTHKTQRASGMCSGLRGVSAYMLLFKLYTLQITKSQIDRLLTHPDSSYIRAIGLLYLRHCCDPKQLFGWRATARSVRTSRVLDDNEKFDETGDNSGSTTIGRFARKLLLEQEFHDTMLPRLPVPIAREIQKNLDERPKVGGEGAEGLNRNWENKREERTDRRDERPQREDERSRDFHSDNGSSAPSRGRDEAGGYGNYDRRWASLPFPNLLCTPASRHAAYPIPVYYYLPSHFRDLCHCWYGALILRARIIFAETTDVTSIGGAGAMGGIATTAVETVEMSDSICITAATGAVTSGGRIDVSTRLVKTTAMSALATTVSPRDLLGIPIFIVVTVVVVTVVEAMQVVVMDTAEGAATVGAMAGAVTIDGMIGVSTLPLDMAAKRVRPNPDAVLSPKAEPAPKVETAAEKLARLRAKQALKNGGVGFLGSIGGDYAGNVSAAPAKGLQRYQQMVREGRQ
ncbi:MAG: hypothetical protein SGPRY_002687, partial [Prymnesium sp.]